MNKLTSDRVNSHAQLAFFTLDYGREKHPRGRNVILEIRNKGYHAFVLKSLQEGKLMRQVAGMVAVFDTDCVGSLWIELQKEDPGVPSWAFELSNGPCVGICQECVAYPANSEKVAYDIIRRFSLNHGAHHDEKERFRRPTPFLGEQYHDRSRERFLRHRDQRCLSKQF